MTRLDRLQKVISEVELLIVEGPPRKERCTRHASGVENRGQGKQTNYKQINNARFSHRVSGSSCWTIQACAMDDRQWYSSSAPDDMMS